MERTKNQSHQAKSHQAIRYITCLNTFERNIQETVRQWDQAIREDDGNYYLGVYSRPPTLLHTISQWAGYTGYLDDTKRLLDSMPLVTSGGSWSATKACVEKNIAANPLVFRVNGTSLKDISQMSLPLSTRDITRIDRMIDKWTKPVQTKEGQPRDPTFYIQSVVNLAATQATLFPKVPISDQARLLIQRLKNYWEYYTAWALNYDQKDESPFFMLKMVPGNHLPWALLSFIPARLHITPSSTYRLIDAHTENLNPSIFRHFIRNSGFFHTMTSLLQTMSPAQIPQAIAKYQYTNPGSEAKLAKILRQTYRDQTKMSQAEKTSLNTTTETLIKATVLYHKHLRGAAQASKDGFLRIPIQTDIFFNEILVGALYGKTLTIVGITEDEQVFVTLDLVQNGQLLGVPPQLQKDNSASANLLIQNLLTPVLREARTGNPLVEFKPLPRYTPSMPASPSQESDSIKHVSKSPKRRAFRSIALITGRQEMPDLSTESLPHEQEEKENYALIYHGQTVEIQDIGLLAEEIANDLIPGDQRLRSDIKLILESLQEDPFGSGTYKIKSASAIFENGQKMSLRSFRGDTRRLPFGNKQFSEKLRTVYYINPKTKAVILEEVMTHKRFDNVF
ncbi:hypothetical protein HYU95_00855 [Candidatus Daviesbacteria bacterium]|nr:hypothetical protein [Candidatus Daviesbacteria bacterium]